mmetsp:Transcript_23031/g.33700  ORF Transcript_23031/g.33700 Transcript_23031/m.33700 type:complete len:380 (+) Transcript_23031:57-1196(+)
MILTPRFSKKSDHVAVQTYEPGMHVHSADFPGKIFACTLESSKDSFIEKLNLPSAHKNFLGVSKTQIIEFVGSLNRLTVGDCHEMSSLVKVKFKRGEIITFQFKSNYTKRYLMFDCAECVNYIKQQMCNSGIQATHTSRKRSLNIATAQGILDTVKDLEEKFSLNPSHHLVTEVMDLLRGAVECLGEANDTRYIAVITHIQNFLQRADVVRILDEISLNDKQRKGRASDTDEIETPAEQEVNSSEVGCKEGVETEGATLRHRSHKSIDAELALLEKAMAGVDIDDVFAEEAFDEYESDSRSLNPQDNSICNENEKDEIEIELHDMLADMSMELDSIVGASSDTTQLQMEKKRVSITPNLQPRISSESVDDDIDGFISTL